MRVMPNRKVRTRDTLRGALSLRADVRGAVSQRCRQCGFMAFRARKRCPVCGLGNWPFAPLGDARYDTQPAPPMHAPHPPQPAPTWSSRVAAAVRGAAQRRPRASSAPLLSILTLVLMVGGYVTFDRMCRADPVCRGQGARDAATINAGAHAADATPTQPVAPPPVLPLRAPADAARATEGEPAQVAAAAPVADTGTPARASGHAAARTSARAATTLARHAPQVRGPDSVRSGMRVADWKGAARRPHPIHRVSMHARHKHRAVATEMQMAELYRGH
ncbi:ATP-dependent serine protease [Burkholderia sp. AU28942]|uniref:ATP-dependent serine protease n=1 Tax=Burkholderia TaxID=32008 RepID=UPI000841BB72|nr:MULTISPECIES: ATP-dependent serine protease [Burkholderia]AOK08183.1 ATP-dependent serine protease [Burkholderia latens]MCA8309607.1 ATP-dependent serine protease [Burkholderia sp. AU28942]